MATILSVCPDSGPLCGSEVIVVASPAVQFVSPVIRIGGVVATILSGQTWGGTLSARVLVPPGAAGTVDVTVSEGGDTGTLAGGYTYLASTPSRLYLGALGGNTQDGFEGAIFPRPLGKRCIGTISKGSTFPNPIPNSDWTGFSFLSFSRPVGWAGGNGWGQERSVTTPLTPAGQLFGAGGFTLPLHGPRNIVAQMWTFAGAGYYWGDPGGNMDKLALYVWRPGTDAIVGTIFDNTGDLVHPAGTLSKADAETIRFTFSGAAVSGIQDGDVLCLEWLGTGTLPSQSLWIYNYWNGNTLPGANNHDVFTKTNGVAAYIEATEDLFASPAVTARPLVFAVT